jgi:hypothetical protein
MVLPMLAISRSTACSVYTAQHHPDLASAGQKKNDETLRITRKGDARQTSSSDKIPATL